MFRNKRLGRIQSSNRRFISATMGSIGGVMNNDLMVQQPVSIGAQGVEESRAVSGSSGFRDYSKKIPERRQ